MSTKQASHLRCAGAPAWVALACLIVVASAAPADGDFSPVPAAPPVELRLPDLEGRERTLDELTGKVVLVNFWASWCTPCITEMPSIQRLAEAMRGKPFAVIGVNVGEAVGRVRVVVQRLGTKFPMLLDKDSAVFNRWGVTLLPTTYVLDGEGMVRYLGRGPLEWDGVEISEALERLLGAGPAKSAAGTTGTPARGASMIRGAPEGGGMPAISPAPAVSACGRWCAR